MLWRLFAGELDAPEVIGPDDTGSVWLAFDLQEKRRIVLLGHKSEDFPKAALRWRTAQQPS